MPEVIARERTRCKAVRKDGTPCRAAALPGRTQCWAHAPANAEKRARACRLGGENSSRAARLHAALPPALRAVHERLMRALEECHKGTLPAPQASAMAALARAMLALAQAGELEARLEALEQRLGVASGTPGHDGAWPHEEGRG